jgi:Flp pilus assembly protein TadG
MPLVRVGERNRRRRRGAAAVELAVLAPLLVFLMLIAVDFARIFYQAVTLDNCARNGALYEADPYYRLESGFANVRDAALADATNLDEEGGGNPLLVSTGTGTDDTGRPYVECTVRQRFRTVTQFPGIPNNNEVIRTVRMSRTPMNPTN